MSGTLVHFEVSDDEVLTTYIESYRTIHTEFGRIADVFYECKTPELLDAVQHIHSDSKWKRYTISIVD